MLQLSATGLNFNFNQNKNKKIDEKNRRLIAKSIPLCEAYSCHLTLVNYETKKNPIEGGFGLGPKEFNI